MKYLLIIIAIVINPGFSQQGFWGAPGEDAQNILSQQIDPLFMATNGAGISDEYLNQNQVAILQEKENVELSVRPGLQDEVFSQLWWALPLDLIEINSTLKFYDRGEVESFNSNGVQNENSDRPILVVYSQGIVLPLKEGLHIGLQGGLSYEHLSHSHLSQSSAAYHFNLGLRKFENNSGYGLLITNLGQEFISSRLDENQNTALNTIIQFGYFQRVPSIPRLKFNLDYQLQAFHQSAIIPALDFSINRNLQIFVSTKLTEERVQNLWHHARSRDTELEKDHTPIAGLGSRLSWDSWSSELGLSYTPTLSQVDFAVSLAKSF